MTIPVTHPPVMRGSAELVQCYKWLLNLKEILQDLQSTETTNKPENDQSKYMPNWVTPPVTSTSSGTKGQMAFDDYYLYVCTDSNTWGRIAFETTWGYLEDMDGDALEFMDGTKIETH